MEIIGVTFTEMIFSLGFAFLESEKEKSVTWALEVCQTMLKDQEKMSKVIDIDHNVKLMNLVARVFPTSYALLCRYGIIENVRS